MTKSTDDAASNMALAADIVAAYVANNSLLIGELAGLIDRVHETIVACTAQTGEKKPTQLKPTKTGASVSVSKSITPDYLICLEDGKKYKSLRRHLKTLGLTPDQYRAKLSLPDSYPMVAANYTATRSAIAMKMGLGRKQRGSETSKTLAAE